MVDEHALEPRWRLPSWHAVRADGMRDVIGARNLDTLRTRLTPSMLRRVRTDVLAQLPPRRDTAIPLQLTREQEAAHQDLEAPIAKLAAISRRRPPLQREFLKLMTLLAKQRMICNALVLPEFATVWPELATMRRRSDARIAELGSPKLADLRERLVDVTVTQRRKVLVFSQWRRMLQLAEWTCSDVLAQAGVRAVFFTGQESQRRRAENLVAFHDDPSVRVLFASDAGGVGLNLQRAASCCINLELPWNPAVLEQRIGRIHRLGQTQPIEVYNYVALGGIEERIAQLVGDKRTLFSGLFDGTSDEVAFDSSGSFLARVQQLVERPAIEVLDEDKDEDDDDQRDDLAMADPDDIPNAEPSTDHMAPAATAHSSGLGTDQLAELVRSFAQVEAKPLANGKIALEMPAPAASMLGGLLRSLASALDGRV